MILHTLNCSPSHAGFRDCLRAAARDDAILLLGNGVYACIAGSTAAAALIDTGAALYVLESDARAAGIAPDPDKVEAVSVDGFVRLTEHYPRNLAWY